ncbi:MAG TPA: response regulator [Candidatus Dormibacteraeota bacterium]
MPSRPSILYVEDDASIAEMYTLGLARAGFDLTVAGDWPSGRRLLRKRTFDLILLDVMLPGPSGMKALEDIRADPALRHNLVGILSNSELTTEVHERAVRLGILGWLTKSRCPPPLVARTIRRWLEAQG